MADVRSERRRRRVSSALTVDDIIHFVIFQIQK
jgi:hypothetical protein